MLFRVILTSSAPSQPELCQVVEPVHVMKVTVVPASTKTGQAALEHLLSSNSPDLAVQGIYRDPRKIPDKFKENPAFEPRQGGIASPETLDFSGSDVVISVTPPLAFSANDLVGEAKRLAENVAEAVHRSGSVRRLIYVSSMGAQHEKGTVWQPPLHLPAYPAL